MTRLERFIAVGKLLYGDANHPSGGNWIPRYARALGLTPEFLRNVVAGNRTLTIVTERLALGLLEREEAALPGRLSRMLEHKWALEASLGV